MATHSGHPVTVLDILNLMEGIAPIHLQMADDQGNNGLVVGDPGAQVTDILIALDATTQVIDEAAALGCQLLITHHPLLYKGAPNVRFDTRIGASIRALCKHDVAQIVAHTNLDAAPGGTNDALLDTLSLPSAGSFADGLGRLARLPRPMSPGELCAYIGDRLHAPTVHVPGNGSVELLAVMGGSGCDFLPEAIAAGADGLLTGETPHHQLLEAAFHGFTLIAAGHHATEAPVVPALARSLQKAIDRVEYKDAVTVRISERSKDPSVCNGGAT